MSTQGLQRLVIGWLTMFVVGSDLFVVSPLLPLIAADYRILVASAGLSVTVFAITYMLSAPLLGRVADQVGREPVLSCCLCAFGAANLATAMAGSLPWLLTARLVAGAAAAGVSPSLYALIAAGASPDRRASSLAIVVSGLLMSLSLGAPLGLLGARFFGWATVFVALGVLGLLLAGANRWVWLDFTVANGSSGRLGQLSLGALAARLVPTVVWSTALYGMYTYLGEGLSSSGYSAGDAAAVIVFYGFGAICGALLGGRLADRIGARFTGAIGLGGLCLCFMLARAALTAGMFVDFAFGVSSLLAQLFFPAQQLSLANEFPASRATVLAWNNSALFFGISVGSLAGGQVVLLGGFKLELLISAAIAAVGWALHQGSHWMQAAVAITQPTETSAAN